MTDASEKSQGGRVLLWTLLGGRSSFLTVALLATGLAVAVGYRCWGELRPLIVTDSRYQVALTAIKITPPPVWIRTDEDLIKQQVAEAAGWQFPLSLLDEQLCTNVATAFRRHPWIRSVPLAVKEYPGKLRLEVVYRKPVGMVEVIGADGRGWQPIDAEGYCLHTADFTNEDRFQYLQIQVPGVQPVAFTGPWGDPRVLGAAKIAQVLAPHREPLGLQAIRAPAEAGLQSLTPLADYRLVFRDGREETWGHPPGQELGAELPAIDKLNRLLGLRGLPPVSPDEP